MRENKTKYAILGMLTRGPMSGYDIKKAIDFGLHMFWSESHGQIYPGLKQLTEDGLITRDIMHQMGKPDRHIYSITERGKKELRTWLARSPEPNSYRIEVLLKLFFGHELSMDENLQNLGSFREQQSKLLEQYLSMEQHLVSEHADVPQAPYWLSTLRCGIRISKAFVGWCDETIEFLRLRDGGQK
ncbi:MAG: PadR family transcriptional regulator [Actinobacteria bacterium]|nr:PadR family transcriptional regulator [Actinomycetota bacterium]